MPIRLGHFYASLLLLVCLGINIAFFPEVREPFLGDEDPLASLKTSFSDLNIKSRFAEIYPKIQSESVSEAEVLTSPASVPKESAKPVESEKKSVEEPIKTSVSSPKPMQNEPSSDPFLLSTPPTTESSPKPDPEKLRPEDFEREPSERVKPVEPKKEGGANRQTAAVVPMPQPVAARPVIADQFKPIESAQPSTEAVWDTIDTVLERPLRYD